MPIADELYFSLGTVLEIVSICIAGTASWFYLRRNFEANSARLDRVEKDLTAHGAEMTEAVKNIGTKLDHIRVDLQKTNHEIVQIAAEGRLTDRRLSRLEKQATA